MEFLSKAKCSKILENILFYSEFHAAVGDDADIAKEMRRARIRCLLLATQALDRRVDELATRAVYYCRNEFEAPRVTVSDFAVGSGTCAEVPGNRSGGNIQVSKDQSSTSPFLIGSMSTFSSPEHVT